MYRGASAYLCGGRAPQPLDSEKTDSVPHAFSNSDNALFGATERSRTEHLITFDSEKTDSVPACLARNPPMQVGVKPIPLESGATLTMQRCISDNVFGCRVYANVTLTTWPASTECQQVPAYMYTYTCYCCCCCCCCFAAILGAIMCILVLPLLLSLPLLSYWKLMNGRWHRHWLPTASSRCITPRGCTYSPVCPLKTQYGHAMASALPSLRRRLV